MKKYILILILIMFSNIMMSQKINDKNIVGKWKVVKISKQPNNINFKDLIKSFNSAIFEFKDNSDFKITTSDKTKLFTTMTDMTQNAKWELQKNNYVIRIGSKSDGYSIMKIIVVEVNEKIIFSISESEFNLEVQKI